MSSEPSRPGRGPLAGCRVLVTRPEGSGAGLVERLGELGARVEARPTIAVGPPADPLPARRAVERLEDYDWVVFTSANGVRFFAELAAELGRTVGAMRARIAAIGPATGRALTEQGARPTLVAGESRSEGLAAALGEQVRAGQRALLVRPERAREVVAETLRGLGVQVEAVACYRTVAAPGSEEAAEQVLRGAYDLIVFTSPSTFRHLVTSAPTREAILSALGGMGLVAIGEITAGAIREAGLRVGAVAGRPSEDGIVQAVMEVAAG